MKQWLRCHSPRVPVGIPFGDSSVTAFWVRRTSGTYCEYRKLSLRSRLLGHRPPALTSGKNVPAETRARCISASTCNFGHNSSCASSIAEPRSLSWCAKATPLLFCYFNSSPSIDEMNAKSNFESMITSEWEFNVAEVYLHETVFALRTWVLVPDTASVAQEH